jgi:hypothetical protein
MWNKWLKINIIKMLLLKRVSTLQKVAYRCAMPQYRSFNINFNIQGLANAMSQTATGDLGSRKINTQSLCDLIGSRYYPHNEEIEMEESKIVKCFDENDHLIGDMTLREAQ